MRDEEYVYYQDLREKKTTGYSARKQRTHCGKGGRVKFPSDYLTKKEIKNMSGECKSYRLNDPMKWEEFLAMPEDIQRDYIKAIKEKYNAPYLALAKMFGRDKTLVSRHLVKLGFEKGTAGKKAWDKNGFMLWCYGVPAVNEDPVEVPVVEEIIEEETPVAEASCESVKEKLIKEVFFSEIPEPEIKDNLPKARNYAYPISGSMNFEGMAQDIMALLDAILFGKNIKMCVSWEVCDD